MPSSPAVSGWISTMGSGSHSRSQGMLRCSEWKKTGERRPVTMTRGYFSASSGVRTSLSGGSVKKGSGSMSQSLKLVRVELQLAGGGAEAGLAVRAQEALLVAAIGPGGGVFLRELPVAVLQFVEGVTRRASGGR